jgi:hypothetical protein
MAILQLAVPLLVAFYFLWLSRRTILAVTGFALIPFIGRALYLDTYKWSTAVLGPALGIPEIVAVLLFAAWAYVRVRRPVSRPHLATPELILAILLGGWIVLEIIFTVAAGGGLPLTLRTSAQYLYPAVGVFLWYDIVSRCTREEALAFLRGLVALTACTAVLYSLQAIGVRVYPFDVYKTYRLGGSSGATLVRDFLTLSPLTFMSFAFLLADFRRSPWWWLQIGAIGLAILLTFTRSLIIAAVVAAIIVVIALLRASAADRRSVTGVIRLLVLFVLAAVAFATLAPLAAGFLGDRFAEVGGDVLALPSVAVRLESIVGVFVALSGATLLVGVGMMPLGFMPSGVAIGGRGLVLGDTMWPPLLLYTGVIGGVLVVAMLLFGLVSSLRMMLRQRRLNSWYPFLAAWFAQLVLDSFISPGWVWMGVIAGLPLALLMVEREGLWLASAEPAADMGRQVAA